MKCRRILFTLIAALCLSSAAFVTSATAQRKTSKRRSSTRTTAKTAAPPAATPTPLPSPTPEKANERPQQSQTSNDASAHAPATDAVRYYYEFNQPDFYVHHIMIEHDATGRGQITFERKNDDAPLTEPIQISSTALARIAAAWAALNFLDSTEDYQAERQMAHLGTMRLRMTAGAHTRTAEFNWTHNPQAAALTNEYRRIADQQLFVFEIEVARQYQPSDSIKLLNGLESLLNRNEVSDPAQLIPLLSDLSDDERIPLIARNQATRLLKKLKK
ncbi:MAG: hypothetical protein DMF64_11795 [Acidobacteria bacterium]|nr:MAG: hypothetical protein DMF64_11795 [Acidobacteriota bacterium]